jgi:hypothetical protein
MDGLAIAEIVFGSGSKPHYAGPSQINVKKSVEKFGGTELTP